MPTYESPGVYIEEVDTGPRPIEGVGTATAAFVGFAPNGPANKPVLVTNWSQFVEKFGRADDGGPLNAHMEGSYLSHAVYGYFLNGGGRCYVVRVERPGANGATTHGGAAKGVSATDDKPALLLKSANQEPALTVKPKGAPSEKITVEVTAPGGDTAPADAFTLRVRAADVEEMYPNVTLKRQGQNVLEQVKQKSKLITLVEERSDTPIAERIPAIGIFTIEAHAAAPARAASAAVQPDDFTGDVTERTGVQGLEVYEDITMVCCPDLMALRQDGTFKDEDVESVQRGLIAHCEQMGDRIAILDPLPGKMPQDIAEWRRKSGFDSKFAALYYPWITIGGPDKQQLVIPPSGHIAGIYARNDSERGVHKAPANEIIRGAVAAATPITKGEQDVLNPIGVNCIRSFSGRGPLVWGARTLSSDPAWRYINVRRLFNYVEKSIERSTQWVVFEPNGPDLWARVKRDVDAFLTGLWRDGMLFGRAPAEAFFVKCDEELNPLDARDRGQLFIDVGLAPVKPAEFVVFRMSQWSGGGA